MRSGRIDAKIPCGLATDEMAAKMFLRFFAPKKKETEKEQTEKKKKQETTNGQLTLEEAEELAKEFGSTSAAKSLVGPISRTTV